MISAELSYSGYKKTHMKDRIGTMTIYDKDDF